MNKLFYNSCKPELIFILETLMDIKELNGFRLVGGTALSLQIGHRMSDDIDLFTNQHFDNKEIEHILKTKFENISIEQKVYGIVAYIKYNINSDPIKIDLIQEEEPFLNDALLINGIRLSSLNDIAAMKLKAITTRKEKKDFIDIFCLMSVISLKMMIDFYEQRFYYNDKKDVFIALSNIHFADKSLNPNSLKPINWEAIKGNINNESKKLLSEYLKL